MHISVESTVGQGTTFHIYLPASSEQVAAARVDKTEIIRGQGRLLVMDDEDAVRAF